MNVKSNSDENFNDLVFENKNKAYGAYAIRKGYSDSVAKSLIVTSAFFCIMALVALHFTNKNIEIPVLGGNDPTILTTIIDVVISKPDKPIIEPKQRVESAPKTTSGQMLASDNKKDVLDKTNDQQIISKNPNLKGNDSAAVDPEIKIVVKTIPPSIIETFVDFMPLMDNMAQFVSDNIKYPAVAKENGTKGIVYVTFVVETDGSITDIKLLHGIGDGCEQEAMRVVGMMPKWKPGMNKGKPARVQCNLPINFRLK